MCVSITEYKTFRKHYEHVKCVKIAGLNWWEIALLKRQFQCIYFIYRKIRYWRPNLFSFNAPNMFSCGLKTFPIEIYRYTEPAPKSPKRKYRNNFWSTVTISNWYSLRWLPISLYRLLSNAMKPECNCWYFVCSMIMCNKCAQNLCNRFDGHWATRDRFSAVFSLAKGALN